MRFQKLLLLIDRRNDPEETRNLAAVPEHREVEVHLSQIARDILATNPGGAAHLIDTPWRNRWA